jgi:UDP-glucose 4-epimerase
MSTVLITGASGFLGQILVRELLEKGFDCLGIDLHPCEIVHSRFHFLQGDIRNESGLTALFSRARIDAVMHVAAVLAHGRPPRDFLWTSNVDGARRIADVCRRYRVPKLVFTSSNCLWGESLRRPVTEEDIPHPCELYGQSKWEAEKALQEYAGDLDISIIRCPTILDSGRLGILAILFEFIDEGRRVWVVGDGSNRYQFIYAKDLVEAMVKALTCRQTEVFGIGADDPKPLEQVFKYVIEKTGSESRIVRIPKSVAVPIMKLSYAAGLSPLGPYHYKMITEDFSFDTAKIKRILDWRPTLNNEEMLYRAYGYYRENKREIRSRRLVSDHRKPANMGAIRLLKWMS